MISVEQNATTTISQDLFSPLWESVGMRSGFASHFRHHFVPKKNWPCLPFYSDLVGSHFEKPHFQHVDELFAPQNWPNLSFHSDLVGHFELRAAHPWLLPGFLSSDHFYWHGSTSFAAWISNYIHSKVWNEILIHIQTSAVQPLNFGMDK